MFLIDEFRKLSLMRRAQERYERVTKRPRPADDASQDGMELGERPTFVSSEPGLVLWLFQ